MSVSHKGDSKRVSKQNSRIFTKKQLLEINESAVVDASNEYLINDGNETFGPSREQTEGGASILGDNKD